MFVHQRHDEGSLAPSPVRPQAETDLLATGGDWIQRRGIWHWYEAAPS